MDWRDMEWHGMDAGRIAFHTRRLRALRGHHDTHIRSERSEGSLQAEWRI